MMPLLDKLFPSRKSFKNNAQTVVASNIGTEEDDRNSALCLGPGQVRILLFRECEWRGRKLLFDSLPLEKRWCKNQASFDLKNNNDSVNYSNARNFERQKTAEDDVSLLSEMVFGTVAMTYRGSSFKIHSMNSPPCIMCTKVFPATEHNTCKQSERVSDEGLGRSVNLDSNSSLRTLLSRPSSGNLSGSESNAEPRKNSTCSSTGSGWDIDIPPPTGSSQSLESNGSSGIGSLSSLRRRWLRAVSTSLARTDSDDAFGMQYWNENGNENKETPAKRHKTRLGLTMLVRLVEGHERKIEACLLEHMALLEGMLDRLRYFCIEPNNVSIQNKGMQLPERLYRSSFQLIFSLLRLLTNVNTNRSSRTPLLWHDVLLNSVRIEHKMSTLHYSLQQMCQLLEDIDTKSTNFFLSTVVTAVLTYHLGWIYTTLPVQDRQLMEKLGTWYPCNPLWAQLGDLYGALSNPIRIAHTVVAGDPQKTDLINSVLSFLSYFIRSGLVQKRKEYCCVIEEDIQEAANILEQARIKRPHLFNSKVTCNDRETSTSRRIPRSSTRKKVPVDRSYDVENDSATMQGCYSQYNVERLGAEGSVSSLKRSTTMETNLDSFMLKPLKSERDTKLMTKEFFWDDNANEKVPIDEKTCTSSKVKIVVSEIASQDADVTKTDTQYCFDFPLRNFEKKVGDDGTGEAFTNSKIDALQEFDDPYVNTLKLYSARPEFETGPGTMNEMKNSHVLFMLGDEEKSLKTLSRPRLGYNCQCSYMFTRVPSTSAQLPEGVLRKIIQRNFPESSKSIQSPPGVPSGSFGFCQKCNGQSFLPPQNYDSYKQVLETPTNATEVLRTCGNTVGEGSVGMSRSNSLEALMEASSVVELPMPRTRKIKKTDSRQDTGFTKTLLQNKIKSESTQGGNNIETSYTWGLVLQGLPKKKKRRKKKVAKQERNKEEIEVEKEWWYCIREECLASARFPTIDQPVAESLCILADLDTWHVGIISNNMPSHTAPLPVGMSRLVSNMLEGFVYLWRKYHSASQCIGILEAKLREMWLKSEALAEVLLATEVCDASIANLTNVLDLDAADIPLLLAVATSHSPEIAQRFGLTLT
ncbi:folliculin-interacting protein 2 isoform X1 [Megachile rotundata]|uniref:folliculin-interacting protein 2 isoform X1 n=2 Tax=Megachile rotundata TaxID=143995 RepID=UPI000258E14D|nr:PREDICTED: folliculin-interacting protein 2 [Megachile rotundata]